MNLKELVEVAHEMSKSKGWYEGDPPNIPEKLALIHSEVSEALEAYRDGNQQVFFVGQKPEGLAVELADAVIRIADLCGYLGIDLEDVVALKMAYNAKRPHRHGGKKC